MKFFLNSKTTSYLRDLETEFKESSNGIRVELNRFAKAGLLLTESKGNKKIFRANIAHPLFKDIHNILLKYVGFDQLIDNVIEQLGGLKSTYVVGSFAKGLDSKVIDLILVGDDINISYLKRLIEKAEKFSKRKIRFLIIPCEKESEYLKDHPDVLLLWMAHI